MKASRQCGCIRSALLVLWLGLYSCVEPVATSGGSLLQFRFTATISSLGYRSATLLVWYAYTSVLSLIFVRIKGFSSGVRIVSYTPRPAARVRILLHHLFFHLVVVVVAVVVVIVVVVS